MILLNIFDGYWHTLEEVIMALAPLLLVFILFQVLVIRKPISNLQNVLVGTVLSIVGLSLFLQGVKAGFLPFGEFTGLTLSDASYNWILIPIGFVLGVASIVAEPAVLVLGYEVEKASSGSIKGKPLIYSVSLGVGIFVALAMARVLYGIPLWTILVPGYVIAFILARFTSKTFISIAFDSGGVATGPMTVTFILALAVGTATGLEGRDPLIEGFGLVALVALAPIIAVLLFGILYSVYEKKQEEPSEKGEAQVGTTDEF